MNPPVTPSLEERMIRFLESQPGAENVEELTQTPAQRSSQQVDFFLKDREILCELKSLQTSTEEKVNALVEPLLARSDVPVFYGSVRLDKLLKHFPDGERIQRDVYDVIVSTMQTFFRKANKQIRASKVAFDLPHGSGGLVVVNDRVSFLSPEVVVSRIKELLLKRTPEGAFAFPEVEAVLLLCETHVMTAGQGVEGPFTALISRDGSSKAGDALGALMPIWARVHGYKYQEIDEELLTTIPIRESSEVSSEPEKITRQEHWERQYRKRPYLRWHTHQELAGYFDLLVESIAVAGRKGATEEERSMLLPVSAYFTHLIQETEERGLDYRSFGKASPPQTDKTGPAKFRLATATELQAAMTKPPSFETGRFYTSEAGDHFRCTGASSEMAQLVQLVVHAGKSAGVSKIIPRPAWGDIWPIVDERLIGDLEKRYHALGG